MSRCNRTPASTGRVSARRASGWGARSITWCRSVTALPWATTLCSALRSALPARLKWATTSFLPDRSASPDTATLGMAWWPPLSPESPTMCPPDERSADILRSTIGNGCAQPKKKTCISEKRWSTLSAHQTQIAASNGFMSKEFFTGPPDDGQGSGIAVVTPPASEALIRVLLLDDHSENLLLRSTILRKYGYVTETASTIHEAIELLDQIDIAVLDYHLGAGQFGTEVAAELRRRRPEVPIIILSATLERRFGGVEDMHLLKGYSSIDDLVNALRSFEAKLRGKPVVVNARDFFYSRINMAMGDDVLLEILDGDGNWQYVNDACARLLERPRDWFPGKNMFLEMPDLAADWREILRTVAEKRETYIDRTYRGLLNLPRKGEEWVWNVLAFPLTLHNDETGVVLTARILERKTLL